MNGLMGILFIFALGAPLFVYLLFAPGIFFGFPKIRPPKDEIWYPGAGLSFPSKKWVFPAKKWEKTCIDGVCGVRFKD